MTTGTMVIVIANQKGGVGKTTWSLQLAIRRFMRLQEIKPLGKKVVLVDTDPLEQATKLLQLRLEAGHECPIEVMTVSRNFRVKAITKAITGFDCAIFDAGGRDDGAMSLALEMADHVVIPAEPTILSVMALDEMVEDISMAKRNNPNLIASLFWNRVDQRLPPSSFTAAFDAARRHFGDIIDVTEIQIPSKTIFARSQLSGLSVYEMRHSTRDSDTTSLADQVYNLAFGNVG